MSSPAPLMNVVPLSLSAIRSKPDKPNHHLTMLPKAFGRFAVKLSSNILNMASTAPSFTFDGYSRTEELAGQEAEENSSLSELLICGDLKQSLRVSLDRAGIYGLCNVVFGGVGNEPAHSEARPFSKIERAITQLFFKIVGRSLPSAFTTMALRDFFVAPAQDPNEEPIYPAFKPFISIKVLCNIHGYSGELLIELPEKMALLFQPVGDDRRTQKMPQVSEWGMEISGCVENIEVELVAVLDEFQMSLDKIASLRTGQVISLERDIASPLFLCSEDITLFTAKLGQLAKKFCLSIERPAAAP